MQTVCNVQALDLYLSIGQNMVLETLLDSALACLLDISLRLTLRIAELPGMGSLQQSHALPIR